jgi:MoaA/NifB/PqqE/SkfB family radical SAM enzyme
MSSKTFLKACRLAYENGENIFLGGGEPTLHPRFWEFLGLAMRYNGTDGEVEVGIITNGSRTEDALALARLAKRGAIYAGLSQDEWHEHIDERVVRAFTKPDQFLRDGPPDLREIRNVRTPWAQGRAKDWGNEGCSCEEIVVTPDGRLYACGCLAVQLGTVERPEVVEWGVHECRNADREVLGAVTSSKGEKA